MYKIKPKTHRGINKDLKLQTLGIIGDVTASLLVISPLVTMKRVIQEKNSVYLSIAMVVATFCNAISFGFVFACVCVFFYVM